MSILKKAGVFCLVACASALGLAAQASAQTKVYVKVVVAPHAAPVHAALQAYAGHHAQHHEQHHGGAPCPHALVQAQPHAPHYLQQYAPAPVYHPPAPVAGVIYNRPHTSIAEVQPYSVQPYYEADAGYYAEPRKHSRWR